MTGADDIVQRYYASMYGRFNTPDPMAASAKAGNPGSWNRYNYTVGDPVDGNDPRGLDNGSEDEVDYDGGTFLCQDGLTDSSWAAGGSDCVADGGPALGDGGNNDVNGVVSGGGGGDYDFDAGVIASVTVTAFSSATSIASAGIAGPFTLENLWAGIAQYMRQYLTTLSVTLPAPNTLGILGVQFSGAYLPQSNLLCGQLSLAAGWPGTVGGVSVGTLLTTNPSTVINTFTGWGGGLNLTSPTNGVGAQYGFSGPTSAWGPTLGTKGSTISAGYGACWQTGSWNLVTSPAGLLPPLAPISSSGAAQTTHPIPLRLR